MTKNVAADKKPPATKAAQVEKLLKSRSGASIAELVEATSWKPHSCRAFLTGLRKKGRVIQRAKRKDGTTYYKQGTANAKPSHKPDQTAEGLG